MKWIFALTLLILFMPKTHAQSLERFKWKNRLVLLFTTDHENRKINQQKAYLMEHLKGFKDRDLKMFIITYNSVKDGQGNALPNLVAKDIRSKFDIENSSEFTFLLIGKDGTDKLRSNDVVSVDQLWGLIDSMPMRKREMNRK